MRLIVLLVIVTSFGLPSLSHAQRSQAKGFGSFAMQSAKKDYSYQRVRFQDGTRAERFEVRAGDCPRDTGDCASDRERVEFSQRGKRQPNGSQQWVAWSVYIPSDFPKQGRRMYTKLGQFHQEGNGGPRLLFELSDRSFFMNMKSPHVLDDDPMNPTGDFEFIDIASRSQMLGKWTRIMVNVRWSTGDDGFVHLFRNGKRIWSYAGPTTNTSKPQYFKYGLYRSFVSRCGGPCPTLVAYYKDVKSGRDRKSVE